MGNVHRTEVRVRYAEVDKMGILHHSRYALYMEIGRTEALRACGLRYSDIEASGRFLVVARLSLKFHAPARYDEVLVVETTLERVTAARVEHTYRILREENGALLAEGATTLACVDAAGRPQRIPASIASLMGKDGD